MIAIEGRFSGRTAVISGASSGIGRAVAERLASEGADLVVMSSSRGKERLDAARAALEKAGGRVATVIGDIAEPETSARAVETAIDRFGRLDHILGNAGIAPRLNLLDQSVEDFDRVMAVNARGMYLLTAAGSRAMAQMQGGSIVCTGSSCSYRALEGYAAYCASKGAVVQLSRSLAVALAPYGVRVNAVLPGLIDAGPARDDLTEPDIHRKQLTHVPMDRPGAPAEVAALIAFLLSDEASYVTGTAVAIDGGESAGWRSSEWMSDSSVEDR